MISAILIMMLFPESCAKPVSFGLRDDTGVIHEAH